MFSIYDTVDTEEPIEIQIENYAEVGHHHEISDINRLEERLKNIEDKLSQLLSVREITFPSGTQSVSGILLPDASTIETSVPSES